jgi:hypothetical protein
MSAGTHVIANFLHSGCIPEAHLVCKVKLFFRGLGGSHVFLFWMVFLGGLLLCEAFMTVQTWFMGYWAEQYLLYPPESVNVILYVNTLVFLLLIAQFFAAISQSMGFSCLLL